MKSKLTQPEVHIVKKLLIAAAALFALTSVAPQPASAQDVSVRIGADRHHHRHYDNGWRHARDRAYCRTVVTHKWRHGHRVTVRERVCR